MKRLRVLQKGPRPGWLSKVGIVLAGALCALPAQATTFRLQNPNDGVVGEAFYLKTRHEDTLLDVARHNNLGYDDMKYANQRVDMWVPGDGSEVLIPTMFVLPKRAAQRHRAQPGGEAPLLLPVERRGDHLRDQHRARGLEHPPG